MKLDLFPTPAPVRAHDSLQNALADLLRCLQLFVPLDLWMVTRVSGDDWYLFVTEDRSYGVTPGTILPWQDSFCSRMVRGEGPCFAPRALEVPSYAAAPIAQRLPIGAYIAQPLTDVDGTLLGTLCGISPRAVDEFKPEQQALVQTTARTVSTLLHGMMHLEQARMSEARLRDIAETDALTGVASRYVWDTALQEQEAALAETGENAAVLLIDLDGLKATNDQLGHAAGDAYLATTGHLLRTHLRSCDLVARIGGDEFAVLVPHVSRTETSELCNRLTAELQLAGVQASIGYGMRLTCGSLKLALEAADSAMYRTKRLRKLAQRAAAAETPDPSLNLLAAQPLPGTTPSRFRST